MIEVKAYKKGLTKEFDRDLPIVTIVTVVFNAEDLIEGTVISVLEQTYKNIEYIVIDGSSTDGTLKILDKYQDKFTHLISEADEGVYYAMNKAIELSSGEWINFMNAGDEFVDRNVVENVFQQEYGKSTLIYGDTIFINNVTNERTLKKARPLSSFWMSLNFNHNSLFCKREVLKKYKFNTHYKIVADSNFIAKCILDNEQFYYADMTINIYLLGGLSNVEGVLRVVERWKLIKDYKFMDSDVVDSFYLNVLEQQFSIKTKMHDRLDYLESNYERISLELDTIHMSKAWRVIMFINKILGR